MEESFKTKLVDIEINGVPLVVYVDNDGVFSTEFKDEEYTTGGQYGDLYRLKALMADTVKSSRLEVPFVLYDGRRGIMRGWHATQRKILVTWRDGTKGSIDTYANVWKAEDVSDETIAEIQRLEGEIHAASKRLRELRENTQHANEVFNEAYGEDLDDWRRHQQGQ